MTLLFIDFDFSPIYKADSGCSWTFSFTIQYAFASLYLFTALIVEFYSSEESLINKILGK